jgi:hypothetical protein
MKRHGIQGFVVAILLATSSASAFATSSDRWPMYQANAGHTGYIPRIIIPQSAVPLWSVQAQGSKPSGLAVSDGLVLTTPTTYFNSTAPLVAQSLADGSTVWSHDFGSVFSVNQPAVDSGLIYLQTSNNGGATFLHCYRVDGTFIWRAPFGSQWEHYLGPIVVNGSVYFDGGSYGGIYSFNGQDGSMNWYAGLPQYDSWSPTWAQGLLVAYTNELDVITPDTGLKLATITDPNYSWSGYSPNQAAVVLGNYAYVTNGGRLIAFDMLQQTIAWAKPISAAGQVATDGTQLFVTSGGALSVRDPATGSLLWSWVPSASGSVTTNIIVTDSHVIAGDGTNTYLINRATHLTDGTLNASGMLAYAADTLVVADAQGIVHAFRLPTDEIFGDSFD